MEVTGRAGAGAVVLAVALGGMAVIQARRVRRLREELRVCREDAIVLEERWRSCRAELREAQRLE